MMNVMEIMRLCETPKKHGLDLLVLRVEKVIGTQEGTQRVIRESEETRNQAVIEEDGSTRDFHNIISEGKIDSQK